MRRSNLRLKAHSPSAAVAIRKAALRDYRGMLALWKISEGVGLSPADSRANIARFLKHNPGLSFVAVAKKAIVGTVLCGHDGRRGFLYHLAVAKEFRRQGLGKTLADKSVTALRARGIQKCHIVVYTHNVSGQKFWEQTGWEKRGNLLIMSKTLK